MILRLILGDQLNSNHPWFSKVDNEVIYLLQEIRQETDYVVHHIQKVVSIFLAMRHFAEDLQAKGHQTIYLKLIDPLNKQHFTENLKWIIKKYSISEVHYQEPDEYRLHILFKTLDKELLLPVFQTSSNHFLSERNEVSDFFKGKKSPLMESFYRYMRKKHHILLTADGPVSGVWNTDTSNRKSLPKDVILPSRTGFSNDARDIRQEIQKAEVKTIGDCPDYIRWPIHRQQSLAALEEFCQNMLPFYGPYQDAMTIRSFYVFHSLLSFALNVKMLHPREVIDRVITEWIKNGSTVPYSSVEGFIRQILGWREYVRGIYWWQMPSYGDQNFFGHDQALPSWYWTGDTNMMCLKSAINQSLSESYAHHIQRLMVTGNFALLAGTSPHEVDAWYLGIYIDAFEWVEMPNTRGMSQYADGGVMASKPYVSSGHYIHKMSDYCKGCFYDVTKKTGDRACPFNSLYWHFFSRNEALLSKNPRIGMSYLTLRKMDKSQKTQLIKQAEHYLSTLESL